MATFVHFNLCTIRDRGHTYLMGVALAKFERVETQPFAGLPSGISSADVDQQTGKILLSEPFAGATRSRSFLRFIVSKLLEGQANQIKEYTIAVEVFGMHESFDSRCSPIVRVEAGRLRKKLRSYIEKHGSNDLMIIDLPKGSYVPVIRTVADVKTPQGGLEPAIANREVLRVLPFVVLDDDKSAGIFSQQLTESLIKQLGQIPDLAVRSGTDLFHPGQKAGETSPVEDRSRTNILLEGAIRRIKLELQVKVILVDLSGVNDQPAIAFDGTVKNHVTSQYRIVSSVVAAAKKLLSDRQRNLHTDATPPETDDSQTSCIGAVPGSRYLGRLDPSPEDRAHARSLARLAHFYVSHGLHGVASPHMVMPRAELAAQESLTCDSCLHLSHLVLGLIHLYYLWNSNIAEWHFNRAVQLAPDDAYVMNWYLHSCIVLAGPRKPLAQLERVVTQRPNSAAARLNLAFALYLLQDHDQAIYHAEQVVEAEPRLFWGHWVLGAAYAEQLQDKKAIKCLKTAIGLSANFAPVVAWLAHFYASRAMIKKARVLVSELVHLSTQKYVSPAAISLAYLALGEKERVMQSLQQALATKDSHLVYLKIMPCFSSLHTDVRFENLVSRIGFMNFADSMGADSTGNVGMLAREQFTDVELLEDLERQLVLMPQQSAKL
jgi:TolB-like protein